MAVAIAKQSPDNLILASRTLSKLENVKNSVLQQHPDVPINLVQIDLGSRTSIVNAASTINSLVKHLNVVINNAAVVSSKRIETEDGLETSFGTNHIGHFLLTNLLIRLLRSGAKTFVQPFGTRIVNVSSLGYRLSPIRFHDPNFQGLEIPFEEEPRAFKDSFSDGKYYHGLVAYGQSKTANILHAVSLNKKYNSVGVKAFAVHPGCKYSAIKIMVQRH